MFDLIGDMLLFASYGNYNALANISISYFDVFLVYIVVIITSIVAGLVLKLPLLPSEPKRYSFYVSALYPTPIIAIGILSIFLVLNYTFMYNGLLLAIIIGILSALFVKYLFYIVFPKVVGNGDDVYE